MSNSFRGTGILGRILRGGITGGILGEVIPDPSKGSRAPIGFPGLGPINGLNPEEAIADELSRELGVDWSIIAGQAQSLWAQGDLSVDEIKDIIRSINSPDDVPPETEPPAEQDPQSPSEADSRPSEAPPAPTPSESDGKDPQVPPPSEDDGKEPQGGQEKPAEKPAEGNGEQPTSGEQGSDVGYQENGSSFSGLRPEVQSLVRSIKKPPNDPTRTILLKAGHTWTEDERNLAMSIVQDLPDSDPRRQETQEQVTRWYKHYYPGNVEWDATGRMIHPEPAFSVPKDPTRIVTSDGQPLEHALERLGRHVAAASGDAPVPDVVMGLQSGLNLVDTDTGGSGTRRPALAEDGEFGTSTQDALHRTLVRLGPSRVEEALALGRFNTFARQGAASAEPDDLKTTAQTIFGPLFPRGRSGDAHAMVAQALQDTVNDFASERPDGVNDPIAVDGDIGPETGGAFKRTVAAVGPEHFTRQLARNLGFLR